MRTIAYKWKGFKVAYVRQKIFFLDHTISKLFFFCTKEAIAQPFVIVYSKQTAAKLMFRLTRSKSHHQIYFTLMMVSGTCQPKYQFLM